MIFVTGDTHAEWQTRFGFHSFPEGRDMTKKNYVLVLGDFGIWDNSKRERYDLDWMEKRPWTTLFIGGIQLLCIGVIGEYIGKIYMEVKKRPRYIISEKTGTIYEKEN